jgi:hypothetical protein
VDFLPIIYTQYSLISPESTILSSRNKGTGDTCENLSVITRP